MTFRITGLDPEPFRRFYGLSDEALAAQRVLRVVADRRPGFPERVELRDASPGETLLLANYVHQPADNPYRASHAVFVREGAETAYDRAGEIPEVLRIRPLSLRAFDASDMLIDAELADGCDVESAVLRLLGDSRVAYLHAHYARHGCYAARITRD